MLLEVLEHFGCFGGVLVFLGTFLDALECYRKY